MRDYLLDIVKHTHALGVLPLIKVTGSTTDTVINAFDKDNRTVVMDGKFKAPIAEFVGIFGMPNLDTLNTILNIPEYEEDAQITVSKKTKSDGSVALGGIDFVNKTSDFRNTYRFMDEETVKVQAATVQLKAGINWGVEIEPAGQSIQRLKFQSQAHSGIPFFSIRLDNGNLVVDFGTAAEHAGSFIFASGISGKLTKTIQLPTAVVNSIFSLTGDKKLKLSDDGHGIVEITVDSGLAVYSYKLPSQKK
jgi:hypothetical protein